MKKKTRNDPIYFYDPSGFLKTVAPAEAAACLRELPSSVPLHQAATGERFSPLSGSESLAGEETAALALEPFCDSIAIVTTQYAANLLYYAHLALLKENGKALWINPDTTGSTFSRKNPHKAENLLALLLADSTAISNSADHAAARKLGFKNTIKLSTTGNKQRWNSLLTRIPKRKTSRRLYNRIQSEISPLRQFFEQKTSLFQPMTNRLSDAELFSFEQWQATLKALGKCLNKGVRTILIYGAGKHTRDMIALFDSYPIDIAGIVDDNPKAVRPSVFPWPVMHPDECERSLADTVLISSYTHETNMWQKREQFKARGLSVERIYGEISDE